MKNENYLVTLIFVSVRSICVFQFDHFDLINSTRFEIHIYYYIASIKTKKMEKPKCEVNLKKKTIIGVSLIRRYIPLENTLLKDNWIHKHTLIHSRSQQQYTKNYILYMCGCIEYYVIVLLSNYCSMLPPRPFSDPSNPLHLMTFNPNLFTVAIWHQPILWEDFSYRIETDCSHRIDAKTTGKNDTLPHGNAGRRFGLVPLSSPALTQSKSRSHSISQMRFRHVDTHILNTMDA